jgi:hypothetical protein
VQGPTTASPDEDGNIVMVIGGNTTIDPIHRPLSEYPTMRTASPPAIAEFDTFALGCNRTAEWYEDKRLQVAWINMVPDGEPNGEALYKHTRIKMLRGTFESHFRWQQAMQQYSCLTL